MGYIEKAFPSPHRIMLTACGTKWVSYVARSRLGFLVHGAWAGGSETGCTDSIVTVGVYMHDAIGPSLQHESRSLFTSI